MTASAQGIDVSAYQNPLTADALKGLDFAFCKATNGSTLADPVFARNWRTMKAAGVRRGAYHELASPAVVTTPLNGVPHCGRSPGRSMPAALP